MNNSSISSHNDKKHTLTSQLTEKYILPLKEKGFPQNEIIYCLHGEKFKLQSIKKASSFDSLEYEDIEEAVKKAFELHTTNPTPSPKPKTVVERTPKTEPARRSQEVAESSFSYTRREEACYLPLVVNKLLVEQGFNPSQIQTELGKVSFSEGKTTFQMSNEDLKNQFVKDEQIKREKAESERSSFLPKGTRFVMERLQSSKDYQHEIGITLSSYLTPDEVEEQTGSRPDKTVHEIKYWSHFDQIMRRAKEKPSWSKNRKKTLLETTVEFSEALKTTATPHGKKTEEERKDEKLKKQKDTLLKEREKLETLSDPQEIEKFIESVYPKLKQSNKLMLHYEKQSERYDKLLQDAHEKLLTHPNQKTVNLSIRNTGEGELYLRENDRFSPSEESPKSRTIFNGKTTPEMREEKLRSTVADKYTGTPEIPEKDTVSEGENFSKVESAPFLDRKTEAKTMIETFSKMGCERFDIYRYYESGGSGRKKAYRDQSKEEVLEKIDSLFLDNDSGLNISIHPQRNENVFFEIWEDLNQESLEKVKEKAFLILESSPGNYHAWVAIENPKNPESLKERLKVTRNKVDADPSAKQSKLAGTENNKLDKETGKRVHPKGTLIKLVSTQEKTVTEESLIACGWLSKHERREIPSPRIPSYRGERRFPSYQKCLENAPKKKNGEPDRNEADCDFIWISIDRGFSKDEAFEELWRVSEHARNEGKSYTEALKRKWVQRGLSHG